jgi:hypothetical protein
MSTRQHLEDRLKAFGPNLPNDFLLKYGRDYPVNAKTYTGHKMEQGQCFMNATHLALADNRLTYVEGYITCHGVPIQHAWVVGRDGVVIDPTIPENDDGRIAGYYGVPFKTDYVQKACKANGVYGLLDYFYAGKTAPKLFELGLEEGQAWLLARPARRTRRKVVA